MPAAKGVTFAACGDLTTRAERVTYRELQLPLRGGQRSREFVAVGGAAHHLQPFEREAPVHVGLEQPGDRPCVPVLRTVSARLAGLDRETVIACAQGVAAKTLGNQRKLSTKRPIDGVALRGNRGLPVQPLRNGRPAMP